MRQIHPNRAKLEAEHREKVFTPDAKMKFHFENIKLFDKSLESVLRFFCIAKKGMQNASDLQLKKLEFAFENLSAAFDGTKFLLITDMHIPNVENQHERIISIADSIDYDYCLLGGDYTFRPLTAGFSDQLKQVICHLVGKTPVYGVLGNHDSYKAAEFLNDLGVQMLLNENTVLQKGGDIIYIVGVDDCVYFNADDLEQALDNVPDNCFKMLLSHPPGLYKQACDIGISLYLAGHTHGGQICLPGGIPIIARDKIPRSFISGEWKYKEMTGYTSTGAGAGGVAARFFCPPEIVQITLLSRSIAQ